MKTDNQLDAAQVPGTPVVEIWDGRNRLGFADVTGNSWTFTTSEPLSPGTYALTAASGAEFSTAWNITVAEQQLDLKHPTVAEAPPADGNNQSMNYYLVNRDVHVVVPNYNMKKDDTVKVHWKGRDFKFSTEIQTVVSPPTLEPFVISKYEVIDVIRTHATIWYTVKRPPGNVTQTSEELTLSVVGNDFFIDAPTINRGANNLRVNRQDEFNAETTAKVRCIGLTEWSPESQPFGAADYLNFPIDPQWLAQNRGRDVLFNWSLRLTPGKDYRFSQLLRYRLP
ncbi:hypothetical protein ACI2KS_17065 [Pseudomonas sp. NPDC087358]|uniref:hypothetical protein n=1 Tax=Pseudomonas sp. NPDC087358 TaxID=3364439 RepID=UPI00384DC6A4